MRLGRTAELNADSRLAGHVPSGSRARGFSALGVVMLAGCTPLRDADERGVQPASTRPVASGVTGEATASPAAAASASQSAAAPLRDDAGDAAPPPSTSEALSAPGSIELEVSGTMPERAASIDAGSATAPSPSPPEQSPIASSAPVPLQPEPSALQPCAVGVRFGDSCYRASLVAMSWDAARGDCLSTGADLVSVDGAEEDAFVGALLDESIWLGASDRVFENAMQWTDGRPVVFAHWGPGQPDLFPGPDCVEKRQEPDEPWYDQPCSNAERYVCESPAPL